MQISDDFDPPSLLPTVYQAIIHRPYADVSGVIKLWETKCDALACAEHEADDEIPRTHVHILISGPVIQRDRFNEILKKELPALEGRKDFLILVKTVKRPGKPSVPYELDPLLTYLAKGDQTRLKAVKNISPAIVEKAVRSWVETDKSDKSTSDSYMELVIKSIVEDIGTVYINKMNYYELDPVCRIRPGADQLFKQCRDRSFYLLYKKNSVIPPGSLHKRVAGSAYLRILEKTNELEEGISVLQEAWY